MHLINTFSIFLCLMLYITYSFVKYITLTTPYYMMTDQLHYQVFVFTEVEDECFDECVEDCKNNTVMNEMNNNVKSNVENTTNNTVMNTTNNISENIV